MLMQIKTIFGAKYIVNVSDAGSYTDSVTGKLRPLIEGDFITCHRDKNRFTVSVSMIGRGAGAFAIEEIVEMKLVKKGKKKFMKMLEDEFKRRNSTCT